MGGGDVQGVPGLPGGGDVPGVPGLPGGGVAPGVPGVTGPIGNANSVEEGDCLTGDDCDSNVAPVVSNDQTFCCTGGRSPSINVINDDTKCQCT